MGHSEGSIDISLMAVGSFGSSDPSVPFLSLAYIHRQDLLT